MGKLDGRKVAILVTDGFEQVEMTKPREALEEAGAETKIVSPKSGQIQGMNHANKGDRFDVDIPLDEARPEEFDALMIPGGLLNPDELRATPDALEFTKHFFREGKPEFAGARDIIRGNIEVRAGLAQLLDPPGAAKVDRAQGGSTALRAMPKQMRLRRHIAILPSDWRNKFSRVRGLR